MRKATEKKTTLLGYAASYLHYPCPSPRATLVCFHGWLDNAASFTPLAEALTEYEIIAWDFFGHGKSAHRHAGERYHYIDLVAFIDAALTASSVKNPVLVGHSMGAGAAALYAGSLGHALKAVVLIEGFAPMTAGAEDAATLIAEGVRGFQKTLALPKPQYKNIADAIAVRMRVNGLTREAATPLVRRATVRTKAGITWRADFRLRAPSMLRLTPEHVKVILGAIKVPALVVLGDAGMKQLRQGVEAFPDFFRHAELTILPGHHHLHMDNAAGVGSAIAGFLRGK